MINKAIEKITKEAMELNTPFGFFIEEHMTELCTSNTVAMKILAEDKSLKEFCEAVTKKAEDAAKKAAKGHTGIAGWGAPDEEFYRQAEEYYGLNTSRHSSRSAAGKINALDLI